MKRVLYIGFNKKFVNPYTESVLRVLGSIMNFTFYGLGYSNQNELDMGLEKWIALQEDFDFIMTDGSVILSTELKNSVDENSLFSMDVIKFKPKGNYLKYAHDFHSFFINSPEEKIILSNFDPYKIKQATIDTIIKTNAYIIDFGGHHLYDSITDINKKYDILNFKANDNWFNFLKKYEERVIVVPHSINSLEFDFTPISLRKNKFTVIGVGYLERKEATKILPFQMKLKHFVYQIKEFIRSKLKAKMTDRKMAIYKSTYFEKITESQLTYCSGGPLLYPVRKYYEIPAKGSVAIGRLCSGFHDLGFKDGENFIIAHNNYQLKNSIKKYSTVELQKIADKGRKLIWEKHSDWARREQLKSTVDLIFQGKFKGSCWLNGQYKNN